MLKSPFKSVRKRVNKLLGNTPPKDRSIGVIDGLTGLTLSGWFISRHPDLSAHRFAVFLDEQALGVFAAELPRPDLESAEGVLACGFSVNLEPVLRGLPRGVHTLHDGQPHCFTLRTVRGRKVAERSVAARFAFRGFLDHVDANGLGGWVLDEARPGQGLELSVYVDGVHFMDIKSNTARTDLTAKGMAGQNAGFELTWPAGMLPAGANIDVRYKASGASVSKSPQQIGGEPVSRARSHLNYLDTWRSGGLPRVTVVVPIFNAYEAVTDCLASLKQTLASVPNVRVLLMDDASPDPRIGDLLKQVALDTGFEVVRNPENMGYTRSVNKAITLCAPDDVVLLNSDTVTTARWLQNLRYCAYARARVATVTALSDNAGAFSSPEIGVYNPLLPHLTQAAQALAITQASEGRLLEVPTGNGFCLYMRRSALDALGLFDEVKFSRGYGEENDYCLRAGRNGWLNLVCDKAYVFHKRSQSFQGEKAALMEAGAAHIERDYPEYRMLTRRFHDAEFSHVRRLARAALQQPASSVALPRILFVISTQSGGTPQTNHDLMMGVSGQFQCLLLRCDSKVLTLSALRAGQLEVLETITLSRPIEPVQHRSDEYDRIVLDLMYRHSVELLHIRHIGWHSLGLAPAAKSMGIPVMYSSHDFYALCPSLNLLDENFRHCGGVCTPGEGTCQIGLWPVTAVPPLKHRFVKRWREMFGEFVDACDQVVTTVDSAADLFLSAYPQAAGRFSVIPHGRDFADFGASSLRPAPGAKLRILVPGNITASKGAGLIEEMARLDTEGRLEFHFLGKVSEGLRDIGVHHGKYQRSEFAAKVRDIAPHLGVVLSVCPETYCHTLTEMWASGLPVLGTDVGAVGDRIRASGAGWLVPLDLPPSAVLAQLVNAVDDQEGFEERLLAVRRWQSTEAVWNDTSTMSAEYLRLYRRLLARDGDSRPCVGLLIKGRSAHPATAHIRVLRPLAQQTLVDARPVDPHWVLAGGADRVDALLIQRDAVPAAQARRLIEHLSQRGVPYVYEIDDLLWQLPGGHTDHAIDEPQKQAILELIRHASRVTTSTPALAQAISRINPRVRVVANAPDPSLWLRPLDAAFRDAICKTLELVGDRPRVLYMGTRSHAADLSMIAPAIQALVNARPDVDIVQIGGGTLLPGARDLPMPKECAAYPDFVAWFRAVASACTVALAPLESTAFNAAKSDIKTLDYGLARLPAVFSRAGPYLDAVTHMETGWLCENQTGSWYDALVGLLGDEALRRKLAEAAFQRAVARSTAPDALGLARSLAETAVAQRFTSRRQSTADEAPQIRVLQQEVEA